MTENVKLREWMERGLYLPPIIRDFHDQKDLFKAIDIGFQEKKEDPNIDHTSKITLDAYPGWVYFHIFVIDWFLWYMARRGYTLQRSRTKLDFLDYNPRREWMDKFKGYSK